MILQALDLESACMGIHNGTQTILEPSEESLKEYKYAWRHSPVFRNFEKEYLFIYAHGCNLIDFCDDKDYFLKLKNTMIAQKKAAQTAKINLEDSCIFDLLPEFQFKKWMSARHAVMERILETVARPPDYEILHKAHVVSETISKQKISYKERDSKVIYNIFGSATGRFTTPRSSVPVLTMKKEDRHFLKPKNDAFVEFDYNAAEVRTLFALSGKEQPQQDIHTWVNNNVFDGRYSREESKIKLFSWLYNFSASDIRLSKFFSRQNFRDFYSYENETLITPFGRTLKVEERKAQNYLLQSTTSDIVIDKAYKIMKLLKNKKTNLAFTLHDSIILDFSKKDVNMLHEIKKVFENTRWGQFQSNCSVGKDFGNLKEFKF
tara:strand:+ start:51 stop:1181 length:1131 start_codon:yes stop_codon:yes gene_type:complete